MVKTFWLSLHRPRYPAPGLGFLASHSLFAIPGVGFLLWDSWIDSWIWILVFDFLAWNDWLGTLDSDVSAFGLFDFASWHCVPGCEFLAWASRLEKLRMKEPATCRAASV